MRSCGSVGIVAAVDKFEAEVDVVLTAKHLTTENEIARGKAGKMLRLENLSLVIELSKESDVRARLWVGGQMRDT